MNRSVLTKCMLIVASIVGLGFLLASLPATAGNRGWFAASSIANCAPQGICAEWYDPGGSMHTAVCCVSFHDLQSSTSFSSCQRLVRGPRSGDGDGGGGGGSNWL